MSAISYLDVHSQHSTILDLLEDACAELYKSETWGAYYKVEQARHLLINKVNADTLAHPQCGIALL